MVITWGTYIEDVDTGMMRVGNNGIVISSVVGSDKDRKDWWGDVIFNGTLEELIKLILREKELEAENEELKKSIGGNNY